jgi:hypothetical protein
MLARPPIRFQSREEAVDRRKRRVRGRIIEQVTRCPSGALTYQLLDEAQ